MGAVVATGSKVEVGTPKPTIANSPVPIFLTESLKG